MRFATCIFVIGARLCTVIAGLSPLTTTHLEDGLLTMSEDGQPVAECIVSSTEGLTRTEYCPITPGFGHRSVACMAVWKGPMLLQQGCHSGQDISLEHQCGTKACIASDTSRPVNFCCCFGPKCNEKYAEAT